MLGALNPKSTIESWTGFHTVFGDIFEAQKLYWNGDVNWASSGGRQQGARTVLIKEKF